MRDGRHGAARLLVVDDNKVNRLLLAAQSGAAGPQRGAGGKRPRGARDAAARELRPAAARHGDAGDERLRGAGAAGQGPAPARPAGHRHVVAGRHRQRRALHRARRRGLPAQAGQSGAAEGAHRREPREKAAARPAEGAGAPLRHTRGRAGPARIRLRARRQAGDARRCCSPTSATSRRWPNRSRPRRRSSCSTPTTR